MRENSATPASICCLRPGNTDHEELPEVGAHDRKERTALQERVGRVLRFLQHPAEEVQEAQLPVDEQRGIVQVQCLRQPSVPSPFLRERDVESENFAEEIVLLPQGPLLQENVVGAACPYLHLRPFADRPRYPGSSAGAPCPAHRRCAGGPQAGAPGAGPRGRAAQTRGEAAKAGPCDGSGQCVPTMNISRAVNPGSSERAMRYRACLWWLFRLTTPPTS